jgi:serine O-acetyltransferase
VKKRYPENESIRNGPLAEIYLFCLRRKWRVVSRVFGLLLGCEIRCKVPERLFIPHPNGIVTGGHVVLQDNVVLLQQVTLGCRNAYAHVTCDDGDPTLEEGVFVGAGAKILGRVVIGRWSIIGANAVITENVPAFSIVVGYNNVLEQSTQQLRLAPLRGQRARAEVTQHRL